MFTAQLAWRALNWFPSRAPSRACRTFICPPPPCPYTRRAPPSGCPATRPPRPPPGCPTGRRHTPPPDVPRRPVVPLPAAPTARRAHKSPSNILLYPRGCPSFAMQANCIPGAVLPLPRGQRPVSAAGGFRFLLSPPQGASGFPSLRCNRLPVFPVSATGGFRLPSVSAAGGFRVPPYIRRGGFQLPPVSAAGGHRFSRSPPRWGGPGFPASAAGGHRVPLPPPQGLRCRRHGLARFYRFDALAN